MIALAVVLLARTCTNELVVAVRIVTTGGVGGAEVAAGVVLRDGLEVGVSDGVDVGLGPRVTGRSSASFVSLP